MSVIEVAVIVKVNGHKTEYNMPKLQLAEGNQKYHKVHPATANKLIPHFTTIYLDKNELKKLGK